MADKAPKEQIQDLKDLVVSYAKQETIDPLKGIGRYIGWAIGGALLLGTGVVFVAIGFLRMLQTEGPDWLHKRGWSTTYPYLVLLVLLALGAVLTLRQTKKKPTPTKDQA